LWTITTARGLTPHGVAGLADVVPSVLSRFMTGRRGLTPATSARVASAPGLGPADLGRRSAAMGGRPAA